VNTQIYRGQLYERIGSGIHVNLKGREVAVGIWQSRCPDCGVLFKFKHQERGHFHPKRRCDTHKSKKRVRDPLAYLALEVPDHV
jgi:hypothetical protein